MPRIPPPSQVLHSYIFHEAKSCWYIFNIINQSLDKLCHGSVYKTYSATHKNKL